jgi:aryl-alcohol dehydrogenase-like predicted oxidoreductase
MSPPRNAPGWVGVGTYRMRDTSPVHRAALQDALELGCPVVDTASNYGDGAAERLVGEVMAGHGSPGASVWTKAGYVSPSLARRLGPSVVERRCRPLSAEASYSLDPLVMRTSVELSLERLRADRIEVLFVHNPEHASEGDERAAEAALVAAFGCCADLIREGVAGAVGVSSNALVEGGLALGRVVELAREAGAEDHLSVVQVPMNMLEPAAAALREVARAAGLSLVAQRPLSARLDGCRVALVDGPGASEMAASRASGQAATSRLASSITERLAVLHRSEDALAFPLVRFLRDAWADIPDSDLLDDIWHRRLAPFLAAVFDEVPEKVARDVAELRTCAEIQIRHRLSLAAQIGPEERLDRPLELVAAEYPLTEGFDGVLVGMRRPSYVATFRDLLSRGAPRRTP